jgi:hypothetical protein
MEAQGASMRPPRDRADEILRTRPWISRECRGPDA